MITCPCCGNKFEQSKGVECVCSKYGSDAHTWTIWCSLDCMEESHNNDDYPEFEDDDSLPPSNFNLGEND